MIANTVTIDFKNLVLIAFVIVFIAVLAYRLMRRDDRIQRTRWGFFIERHRYEEEEELWDTPAPKTETDKSEKVTEQSRWPVSPSHSQDIERPPDHGWPNVDKSAEDSETKD